MRGAAAELLTSRETEVCAAGAAGTGKSVAMLLKLHVTSLLVPNCTSIILRQTHASLTASTLRTFEHAIAAGELASGKVKWFGGSGSKPAGYRYPNGSIIMVGGLDQPGKFLSMDLDRIAIDEANQVSVVAYETLLTRLRGKSQTYKQITCATNPDHPDHWLRLRANEGSLKMLTSVHKDNPYLFGRDGTPTPDGVNYLNNLGALTGIRRDRYLKGLWVAAEGRVFDDWRDEVNVIMREAVPEIVRTFWAIDFGYSNPFVFQRFGLDSDGRMYLLDEIHQTQTLVEDHARRIKELMNANGWPRPEAIICDHDAEDRATLTRHLGMSTVAARKAVSRGVQLMQSRIRPAGDGKPRLYVVRDALIGRDSVADVQKRPRGFLGEVNGYVWSTERGSDGIPKEVPLKLHDHSMDAARYAVAYLDWHQDGKVGNPAARQQAQPTSSAWSRPVGR